MIEPAWWLAAAAVVLALAAAVLIRWLTAPLADGYSPLPAEPSAVVSDAEVANQPVATTAAHVCACTGCRRRSSIAAEQEDVCQPPAEPPPQPEEPLVAALRQCVYAVVHFQAFNPETLPAAPASWPVLAARRRKRRKRPSNPSLSAHNPSALHKQQQQQQSRWHPQRVAAVFRDLRHIASDPALGAFARSDHAAASAEQHNMRTGPRNIPRVLFPATESQQTHDAHAARSIPADASAAHSFGVPAPPAPAADRQRPIARSPRRSVTRAASRRSPYASGRRRHQHNLHRIQEQQQQPPVIHSGIVSRLLKHHYTADSQHEWNLPAFGVVRFTDHAPVVFAAIREIFGYSLADLEIDLLEPLTVKQTEGKSDAAFLSTSSGKFLFKTLRGSEPENLKTFLSDYIPFIASNPDTLLPRFLGMFTFDPQNRRISSFSGMPAAGTSSANLQLSTTSAQFSSHFPPPSLPPVPPSLQPNQLRAQSSSALQGRITVLLMANVFDTQLSIDRRFDFKGSNIGRQALKYSELSEAFIIREEISEHSATIGSRSGLNTRPKSTTSSFDPIASIRSNVTLKELDYSRLLSEGAANLIQIGPERKAWLIDRLTKDTALLKQHGFMDYSLLIGVHTHRKKDDAKNDAHSPNLGASESYGSLSEAPLASTSNWTFSTTDQQPVRSRQGRLPHYLSAFQNLRDFMRGSPPKHGPIRAGRNASMDDMVIDIERGRYNDADSDDTSIGADVDDRGIDEAHHSDNNTDPESPSYQDGIASAKVPIFKQFYGGMQSNGPISLDIEYEVYFFGLIDALQKYDYFKWFERNVKRQTSQIIHGGPNALTSLFSGSNATLAYQLDPRMSIISATPPLSPPSPGTSLSGQASNGPPSSILGQPDRSETGYEHLQRHSRSRSVTFRRFPGFKSHRPSILNQNNQLVFAQTNISITSPAVSNTPAAGIMSAQVPTTPSFTNGSTPSASDTPISTPASMTPHAMPELPINAAVAMARTESSSSSLRQSTNIYTPPRMDSGDSQPGGSVSLSAPVSTSLEDVQRVSQNSDSGQRISVSFDLQKQTDSQSTRSHSQDDSDQQIQMTSDGVGKQTQTSHNPAFMPSAPITPTNTGLNAVLSTVVTNTDPSMMSSKPSLSINPDRRVVFTDTDVSKSASSAAALSDAAPVSAPFTTQTSAFPSHYLVHPENSVEEPNRYASRLIDFIRSIVI